MEADKVITMGALCVWGMHLKCGRHSRCPLDTVVSSYKQLSNSVSSASFATISSTDIFLFFF